MNNKPTKDNTSIIKAFAIPLFLIIASSFLNTTVIKSLLPAELLLAVDKHLAMAQTDTSNIAMKQYYNSKLGLSVSYPSYWNYVENYKDRDVVFYVPSAQNPNGKLATFSISIIFQPGSVEQIGKRYIAIDEQSIPGFQLIATFPENDNDRYGYRYTQSNGLFVGIDNVEAVDKVRILDTIYTASPLNFDKYFADASAMSASIKVQPASSSTSANSANSCDLACQTLIAVKSHEIQMNIINSIVPHCRPSELYC